MSDFFFQCPFCKQPMDAPASMMGQLIDCPGCGKPIEVAKTIPDWKRPPGPMPTSAPPDWPGMFKATMRWILFIPAAIVGGMATALLLVVGAFILPQIFRHILSGIGAAGGTVVFGLIVAPKKNQVVKWVLIALVVVFGALDALGSVMVGDDRTKAAIGVSMIVGALMFSTVDPAKVNKAN